MTEGAGGGGRRGLWDWIGGLSSLAQVGLGIATLVVGGGVAAGVVATTGGSSPPPPHSTNTSSAPSTASTSGVVYYSGSAGITATGVDFDQNPPMPAAGDVIATFGTTSGVETTTPGVLVSKYGGSPSPPSELQCRNWAHSHPATSVSAEQGDLLCFITLEGRTVLFAVTNVVNNSNGIEIDGNATVWNAP